MDIAKIAAIAARFRLEGEVADFIPVVQGLVNATFRLETRRGADIKYYALQNINKYVFKQPELVMENICAVTDHLRGKIKAAGGDSDRETLTVIPCLDGRSFHVDGDGEYWRVYDYITGASTYETVRDARHLYNAGYAFGKFQTMLTDFPMKTLHDTIPDFHNTKKRMEAFFASVREDKAGRAKSVAEELDFFKAHAGEAARLSDMRENGFLPTRVTHNDTKYNNILIDDATGDALCVLDLDTVMPGLAAYDYGDAVRFAASSATEDETDLSKVYLKMDLFEQFTGGFISATTGLLTPAELDNMVYGPQTIAIELASRFLKDYLDGDLYFRTMYDVHNLDRARTQIALFKDMEKRFDEMQTVVRKYL